MGAEVRELNRGTLILTGKKVQEQVRRKQKDSNNKYYKGNAGAERLMEKVGKRTKSDVVHTVRGLMS